jgi:hypothetical protein
LFCFFMPWFDGNNLEVNMAHKTCPICGGAISEWEKPCPHCGVIPDNARPLQEPPSFGGNTPLGPQPSFDGYTPPEQQPPGFGGNMPPVQPQQGFDGYAQPGPQPESGGYTPLGQQPGPQAGSGGYTPPGQQPGPQPGFGGYTPPPQQPGFGGYAPPPPPPGFGGYTPPPGQPGYGAYPPPYGGVDNRTVSVASYLGHYLLYCIPIIGIIIAIVQMRDTSRPLDFRNFAKGVLILQIIYTCLIALFTGCFVSAAMAEFSNSTMNTVIRDII